MYMEHKPIELSPYDDPDIYPGPRPSSSFIYFKGRAHKIIEEKGVPVEDLVIQYSESQLLEGSFAGGSITEKTVRSLLNEHNFLPISKRVPLVAYGSNVCLAQLKYKFSLNKEISDFVICLRGSIQDTDIVYGSFLAPYGSLPAIIAPVEGTQTEIWLTFVDPEQLEHMNSTEGRYELRVHDGQKLSLKTEERFEKVYAYYFPHALSIDHKWFRFKDISGISPIQSIWQAEMLNKLIELVGFKGTREKFIHQLRWDQSFLIEIENLLLSFDDAFVHPDWLVPQKLQTVDNLRKLF
ncbi:hypothetical protein GCM10009001_05910 [Virgibacillus siamensis]|uniref:Uncharacterized protein n=1 Tax=Virgibacillus siamensis TaxID=480071 RepID=A0ABN1FK76_9BACI